MGRSFSVYLFCLAMDPLFVYLNRIPGVISVQGYVDDTTIIGNAQNPDWMIQTAIRILPRHDLLWISIRVFGDVLLHTTNFLLDVVQENFLMLTGRPLRRQYRNRLSRAFCNACASLATILLS